jgi:hypothetical protein
MWALSPAQIWSYTLARSRGRGRWRASRSRTQAQARCAGCCWLTNSDSSLSTRKSLDRQGLVEAVKCSSYLALCLASTASLCQPLPDTCPCFVVMLTANTTQSMRFAFVGWFDSEDAAAPQPRGNTSPPPSRNNVQPASPSPSPSTSAIAEAVAGTAESPRRRGSAAGKVLSPPAPRPPPPSAPAGMQSGAAADVATLKEQRVPAMGDNAQQQSGVSRTVVGPQITAPSPAAATSPTATKPTAAVRHAEAAAGGATGATGAPRGRPILRHYEVAVSTSDIPGAATQCEVRLAVPHCTTVDNPTPCSTEVEPYGRYHRESAVL